MLSKRSQLVFFALVATLLTVAWARENVPGPGDAVVREARAHMLRYITLANQEKTEVVAREIYETPILMIPFDNAQHRVQDSTEEFRKEFDEHLAQLKKQNWKQFKLHRLDVRSVGKDLAFVDMHFVWLKVDGKPIGPDHRVASYVLAKKKNGWRIIAVMGNRQV
ncbi:MAG: nuclear transport factor 2 family protein [Planctomycetota bacterium]|nr:nuclear transport factor 2 family protein [Planctomycetota bacterium]